MNKSSLNNKNFLAGLALSCLVVQTTAAVVLTRYSKLIQSEPNADGTPRQAYSNASLVTSTELTKLIASLLLVFVFDTEVEAEKLVSANASASDLPATLGGNSVGGSSSPETSAILQLEDPSGETKKNLFVTALLSPERPFLTRLSSRYTLWRTILNREIFSDWIGTFKLVVPALLYTVQNNVIYIALDNLDATTFQVGYQSKVVTTAILSVLMLNRSLSFVKWVALFVLTLGIVLTQLQPVKEGNASGSSQSSPKVGGDMFKGLIAVVTASCCSAFAGVYFEKILKGTAPSVWVRNAQLAFFSMFIGAAGFYLTSSNEFLTFSEMVVGYFKGYNAMAIAIILIQALGGLIIACVVKYADNILKGFATAMSIVLCGILSAMFMGMIPNAMFVMGCMVVIAATILYSRPDN